MQGKDNMGFWVPPLAPRLVPQPAPLTPVEPFALPPSAASSTQGNNDEGEHSPVEESYTVFSVLSVVALAFVAGAVSV